jgi:muconolactone delta-isomerase
VQTLLLQQLWRIVNETQTQIVFELNDGDLVEQLITQLARKRPLSPEENELVRAYLYSKTTLIRDLAHARLWRY